MTGVQPTEILSFPDAAAWDAWLAVHHGQSAGAWLKVGKKNARTPAISLADAADVALCYGWIDSIRRSLDADCFLQRYSPRRPRGSWSRVNVDRAEALIAAGRMRAPGLAEIEAARADGRWAAAYEGQKNATVPPDLLAALAANPAAEECFGRLGKTERYLAMLPVLKAPTPQTRAARLRKLITDLASPL